MLKGILVICEVKKLGFIVELFNNYGYIVLMVVLILELIAFPLPGEAIMTYCGYVIYEGKMNFIFSILIATIGVGIGITVSYFLGRVLEVKFIEKYGRYIHMDNSRLDKISTWFDRYGNKLLVMAYFIPGIRHVTGYFSGISKLSYKKFAANAYIGALIWTTTFISLGRVFGVDFQKYHLLIKKYLLIGTLVVITAIIFVYIYRAYKQDSFKIAIFK
ncbi:inner membrane protein YghB [Clostridium saccharobutylicum]|uniref:Inner membrane protein YghB n=1 Tax=Clostridium saccharobutylicum TaxID=169679 RepID=A0A1S8MYY3_CLOSA|nr:inner membrane protein YghB [Clostridium saccharobutylicum]